jgi:hypothetical protein
VKNYLVVEDLTSKNIMMKVVTKSSNLNIRKGPGTQYESAGKAAHNSQVQLIKKMNNGWYYINSAKGIFGFCSTEFLAQIQFIYYRLARFRLYAGNGLLRLRQCPVPVSDRDRFFYA